MVTLNVLVAVIALWQRHQSASEARRRRLKRIEKKRKKQVKKQGIAVEAVPRQTGKSVHPMADINLKRNGVLPGRGKW